MAGSTEPGENLVRMEGGSSASDELVKSQGDLLCPSLCYLAPSLSAFLILLVRKNLQIKTSSWFELSAWTPIKNERVGDGADRLHDQTKNGIRKPEFFHQPPQRKPFYTSVCLAHGKRKGLSIQDLHFFYSILQPMKS